MLKELSKTKNQYSSNSIERRLIEHMLNRESKFNNYFVSRKKASWGFLLSWGAGIASSISYLILLIIVAVNKNELNLEFILGTSFIPILSFLSIFSSVKYQKALEFFNPAIPKDNVWFYKRGKAEFIGRIAIFSSVIVFPVYIFLISGDKRFLIVNSAFVASQLLKVSYAASILWISNEPKRLLSPKIIALVDSLFYVSNIWLMTSIISFIVFLFVEVEGYAPEKLAMGISIGIILNLIATYRLTLHSINAEKKLTLTHEWVTNFIEPKKLLLILKDDFERFYLQLTDFGKISIPKSKAKRKFQDEYLEKKGKQLMQEKKSISYSLLGWVIIAPFLYIILVWCGEFVKVPYKKIIAPMIEDNVEGLNPFVVVLMVLIVSAGILKMKNEIEKKL